MPLSKLWRSLVFSNYTKLYICSPGYPEHTPKYDVTDKITNLEFKKEEKAIYTVSALTPHYFKNYIVRCGIIILFCLVYFSNGEIWAALKSLAGYEASGSVVCTFSIHKKRWDRLHVCTCRLVLTFYNTGYTSKKCGVGKKACDLWNHKFSFMLWYALNNSRLSYT